MTQIEYRFFNHLFSVLGDRLFYPSTKNHERLLVLYYILPDDGREFLIKIIEWYESSDTRNSARRFFCDFLYSAQMFCFNKGFGG